MHMKYLVLLLVLLTCLQTDASAQRSRKYHRHHRRGHYARQRPMRHTFYRTHDPHATTHQPSPYKGDNTPINDGQQKNKHRNMNYNTGQPLPSNTGR